MSKQTKAEADYRRGDPIDSCGTCANYLGHHRCSQVMGNITPYGISNQYRRDPNPFGSALTSNDLAQIKGLMQQRVAQRGGNNAL